MEWKRQRLKRKEYVEEKLEYEGHYIIKKYNGKGYDKCGKIIYEINNLIY